MNRDISGLAACLRIARLTRTRLLRGKVLWISSIVGLVPVLMVLTLPLGEPDASSWFELFDVLTVLLVVVPALHLAPWLVEELDERTYTYLWSRPLPRWTLLAGKLLGLFPFVLGVSALALLATFLAMFGAGAGDFVDELQGSLTAICLGVIGWSAIAIGIGGIVPRYATATVIVYFMFLDTTLGGMPFSVQNLAISFHMSEIQMAIARDTGDLSTSILWILGLSAVWVGVAIWRVTRAEYSTNG